jgi:hypothetical protein
MEKTNDSNSVLTREFLLKEGGIVLLDVAIPRQFPDSQDYICQYRISGLLATHEAFAGGVDALQSLQLALYGAAAFLMSSKQFQEGDLYWLEANSKDLGLPVPDAFK